ncbi:MAG: hypothetical protein EPO11_02200 [Gammaproteobacteria bacterium]|nr:MAG: hypothetical protein EPO11_02200 [Gammaproteobacteria bacterium]
MQAPIIVKPIPNQIINEQAAYGPFELKNFIQSPPGSTSRFSAALDDGQSLPKGMICTQDGVLTGIPARGTQGNHEVIITVENEGGAVQAKFILTIKPSLANAEGVSEYADELKAEIWQALDQNLPAPDLAELYNRAVTPEDVYYLLERWASLIVWDAFNLDPPGESHPLKLDGASPHFNVVDRGCCIVASPKDLFSHERTLEDALQTGRAVGREVYKRNWVIELAGFEKMVRATWVEIQIVGDKHNKPLEVLNFTPTSKELRVYDKEAISSKLKPDPL